MSRKVGMKEEIESYQNESETWKNAVPEGLISYNNFDVSKIKRSKACLR